MSKSSQPPRGKNTALNHSMRQEGLHILVTHSQNQEPGRSLDKSRIDVTHTFFHLQPQPSGLYQDRLPLGYPSSALLNSTWAHPPPHPPLTSALWPRRPGELKVEPLAYLQSHSSDGNDNIQCLFNFWHCPKDLYLGEKCKKLPLWLVLSGSSWLLQVSLYQSWLLSSCYCSPFQ